MKNFLLKLTKKNYTLLLVMMLSPILFLGCTTTIKTTKKSGEVETSFQRIYMFFNITPQSQAFTEGFAKQVKEDLRKRNVSSEIYITQSLGSETRTDINRIKAYQPDAIMIVRESSKVSTKGPNPFTFDIDLFSGSLKNLIWEAEMNVPYVDSINKKIEKAANAYVSKLEQENVIPSTPL